MLQKGLGCPMFGIFFFYFFRVEQLEQEVKKTIMFLRDYSMPLVGYLRLVGAWP